MVPSIELLSTLKIIQLLGVKDPSSSSNPFLSIYFYDSSSITLFAKLLLALKVARPL
jgi:hypothetical protein